MNKITDAEFLAATKNSDENNVVAISTHYDASNGRIMIDLSSGVQIGFIAKTFQGLESAKIEDFDTISITPSGRGIYVENLDVDIYIPSLLQGILGSKKWMASQMGKMGGKVTSLAKSKSSKENGKLGGRPRKAA